MGELRVNGYIVPDDLLYTESDEWVRKEGEVIVIGITDYAQKQLKDIVGVDLPEPGQRVSKGEAIATIDSIKTAADIYSPVTGEVKETNEILLEAPELINNDPYGEGWIAKIAPENAEELESLLTPQQYVELIKKRI